MKIIGQVRMIGDVANEKQSGCGERRDHAIAMGVLSLFTDENIAGGQKDSAQAIEAGIDRWEVQWSHWAGILGTLGLLRTPLAIRMVPSPSPRPLPWGEGVMVARLRKITSRGQAPKVVGGTSLSPRERAGVRGKGVFDGHSRPNSARESSVKGKSLMNLFPSAIFLQRRGHVSRNQVRCCRKSRGRGPAYRRLQRWCCE